MKLLRSNAFRKACRAGLALLVVCAVGLSSVQAADKHDTEKPHAEAGGAHGADSHGHGGGTPNPMTWDRDLAVWTLVVFVVLFAVLSKFAWGPIAAALEKREHAIAANIAAAKQAQDEAQELLAGYEKRLAGAADQVREMLDEARRDAEHTKQEIVAEAKSAAQAEHDRAMRDIRTAADAAVKDLSEKSADLAIELAGKVISQKLTADERKGLVHDAVGKFAAASPSQN